MKNAETLWRLGFHEEFVKRFLHAGGFAGGVRNPLLIVLSSISKKVKRCCDEPTFR
jgi:hypothetical protein